MNDIIYQNLESRQNILRDIFKDNPKEEAMFFMHLYMNVAYNLKNNLGYDITQELKVFWQKNNYSIELQNAITLFFEKTDFWQATKFVSKMIKYKYDDCFIFEKQAPTKYDIIFWEECFIYFSYDNELFRLEYDYKFYLKRLPFCSTQILQSLTDLYSFFQNQEEGDLHINIPYVGEYIGQVKNIKHLFIQKKVKGISENIQYCKTIENISIAFANPTIFQENSDLLNTLERYFPEVMQKSYFKIVLSLVYKRKFNDAIKFCQRAEMLCFEYFTKENIWICKVLYYLYEITEDFYKQIKFGNILINFYKEKDPMEALIFASNVLIAQYDNDQTAEISLTMQYVEEIYVKNIKIKTKEQENINNLYIYVKGIFYHTQANYAKALQFFDMLIVKESVGNTIFENHKTPIRRNDIFPEYNFNKARIYAKIWDSEKCAKCLIKADDDYRYISRGIRNYWSLKALDNKDFKIPKIMESLHFIYVLSYYKNHIYYYRDRKIFFNPSKYTPKITLLDKIVWELRGY